MPSRHHIHRYKKVDISVKKGKEYIVFKCTLPDCSHYVPEGIAEGRESICNYCENRFILTKKSMQRVKPHCGCKNEREIESGVLDMVRHVMEKASEAVKEKDKAMFKPEEEKEKDVKIDEGH